MNNKLLIGLIVLVFIAIGALLIFSSPDKKISGSVISGSVINGISDEARYAKFSAELACDLVDNLEGEEILDTTLSSFEKYGDKYDFSTEEIQTLQLKYGSDLEFQKLVLEEME